VNTRIDSGSEEGGQLTPAETRRRRVAAFESAVAREYEDKLVYACPLCRRRIRGMNMPLHLSREHRPGRKSKKLLSSATRGRVHAARFRIDVVKTVMRSNVEWHERNRGKGVLDDAHVAGSNLRKIDK
jgi:hypothetical protein